MGHPSGAIGGSSSMERLDDATSAARAVATTKAMSAANVAALGFTETLVE